MVKLIKFCSQILYILLLLLLLLLLSTYIIIYNIISYVITPVCQDGEIVITDLKDVNHIDEEPLPELFWEPTLEIRNDRLKRHLVEFASQGDFESDK